MAKKKLNKKVALIGSAVFLFLAVAAIGLILHLSRSPEKFIKDGDAAVNAADAETDEQIKEEEYKKAERNYKRAFGRAKSDSLKIEMLFNAHFETFTKNSQNFDLLKTMLHNFKIEKESFTKYMKRIKAYYKKAFPNRKKNNLRYYQRIIEEDIDELEEMIEKFDIQNEKISKN